MNNNTRYILEEEFIITSADTDFTRKLSVSALTNMFIQIAWHHAEELGFGIEYLNKNGLAWVLSKFHLKIDELPFWNETVRFVTWPKGIRRLFYLRDLEVFNQNGERIAYATSEWLLIDVKSKRPKLKGPDEAIFNINKNKHAIDTEIKNLIPQGLTDDKFTFVPLYSDIDLNQHLTTTRYIEWMFDTFNMEFHSKHSCCQMILNFHHEISYSEEIIINRISDRQTNKFFFAYAGIDNKEHFKGKLVF